MSLAWCLCMLQMGIGVRQKTEQHVCGLQSALVKTPGCMSGAAGIPVSMSCLELSAREMLEAMAAGKSVLGSAVS